MAQLVKNLTPHILKHNFMPAHMTHLLLLTAERTIPKEAVEKLTHIRSPVLLPSYFTKKPRGSSAISTFFD